MTQLTQARKGIVTPAMETVAASEYMTPEQVRDLVASGRLIIPANKVHLEKGLVPMAIGANARTKINANLGNSPISSDIDCELEKVRCAVRYGADTVMDLSTGQNINQIRQRIVDEMTVPVGTVPLYQMVETIEKIEDMKPDDFVQLVEQQAKQGVDYFTIHCGLLRSHIELTDRRKLGIVSRGGSLVAKWMVAHKEENPFYQKFDDLCDVMKQYDVAWSMGDGLRPGCLADATDQAELAELATLSDLCKRAWDRGCQVMIEGPGHVPMDQIVMNMKLQQEWCCGAPFYVLGPVTMDCAPGYDHITSVIGGAIAAMHGAAMLCYVTPREHIGLPMLEDVHQGVIAYKIAAHAADIARKLPHARDLDDAISDARAAFDWNRQFELALDPETARRMREESLVAANQKNHCGDERFCSMCGPKFCSIRISQEMQRMRKEEKE